jgi:hypothetical protein
VGPAPRAGSGPIGTAHPTLLVDADPEARWVALCQARKDTDADGSIRVGLGYHGDTYGDALEPYLVLGDGDGTRLDDFVSASADGRHVVVVERSRLVMIDVVRGQRLDLTSLGADTSDDPGPFGPHRAASFDAAGKKLAYVRRKGKKYEIVTRELASGSESIVDPGAGLLLRAELTPDGAWIDAWVVAQDSDGNGKLEPPSVHTSLASRRCRGPITSYSTGGMRGDRPERRMARASGGTLRAAGDVIGTYGDGLLVRGSAGELELVRGAQRTVVAPKGCEPQLLHADASRQRILIGCKDGGQPDSHAILYGPKGGKRLELRTLHPSNQGSVRWVRVNGYTHDAFLDLDRDRVFPLASHEWARAVDGPRAVVAYWDGADSHEVRWVDAAAGKRKTLVPLGAHHGYAAAVQGPMIAIAGKVFDARTGRELGAYESEPLALDTSGRVLVAAERPQRGVPLGPLAWKKPR